MRELASMAARPLNLAYQGWSVWPGSACVHDGLSRGGNRVRAVLPPQLDAHHLGNFPDTYEWFRLAEKAAPAES